MNGPHSIIGGLHQSRAEPWQRGKRLSVGAYDGAIVCDRCCSDDQIVSAARQPYSARVRKQGRVDARHGEVVGLDRHAPEDAFHELLAAVATLLRREFHPNKELGSGDRRDGDVVVVGNDGVEGATDALAGDEHARIED